MPADYNTKRLTVFWQTKSLCFCFAMFLLKLLHIYRSHVQSQLMLRDHRQKKRTRSYFVSQAEEKAAATTEELQLVGQNCDRDIFRPTVAGDVACVEKCDLCSGRKVEEWLVG